MKCTKCRHFYRVMVTGAGYMLSATGRYRETTATADAGVL